MMEYLNEVKAGLIGYTSNQKLVAVLFVVLLILWVKDFWKEQKLFVTFGIVMTLLCLCPFSAILLMKYQTRFYDYPWIWSLVPCLLYVAYGITLLYRETEKDSQRKTGQKLVLYGLILGMLLCCICPRPKSLETIPSKQEIATIETNLDALLEAAGENEICLWAPDNVMEYARSYNGNIRLYYGRNINDQALNAYSYDSYEKKIQKAHIWMNGVCENGKINQEDLLGAEIVKKAFRSGVTHILIPKKTVKKSVLKKLKKKANVKSYKIDDYIVLVKKR